MKSVLLPIKSVKVNPNNPRILKDEKFNKLKQSITDAPWMLDARPIVIDEDNIVLGGNMRYQALKDLGYKEIHCVQLANLTPEQKQEFIIKDNVSFGEWDWEVLANEWDVEKLEEWGLELPTYETHPNYSILEDTNADTLNQMEQGVKKAIQIEFDIEDYAEAQELVKFWREQGAYVGGMIIEYFKTEKENL